MLRDKKPWIGNLESGEQDLNLQLEEYSLNASFHIQSRISFAPQLNYLTQLLDFLIEQVSSKRCLSSKHL